MTIITGQTVLTRMFFYDKDGRMWMVYGSWSGGIFLIEIDEETGYPIYPEADEENTCGQLLWQETSRWLSQLHRRSAYYV